MAVSTIAFRRLNYFSEIQSVADIFLIYGREDENIARKLVEHLETRWSVWWDRYITERFLDEIPVEIEKAQCVVVLWSKTSRVKDFVRDEVQLAKDQDVRVVSATLDGSNPSLGFGGYTTTSLQGWNGKVDHPAYEAFFSRLMSVLQTPKAPPRPTALANDRVPLPTLFLSVSSFETQLLPDQAVKALRIAQAPTILVSAWDLVERRKPARLITELENYRSDGGFVLLDSGNYESSRLQVHEWEPKDLEEAMAHAMHDWAFCFDKLSHFKFDKNRSPEQIAEKIVEIVKRDQEFTATAVLPVVHVPQLENSGYHTKIIPKVVRLVADKLRPELIGIPERELGAGIVERTKTMRAIRLELNTLSFYQPVHLLGTGNPWTVAIMVAAGADAFDGLEWCRTVVDHEKDRLNHFQHFDFFIWQAKLSGSVLVKDALEKESEVAFAGKVAFHNLDYFNGFGDKLRGAVEKGRLESFVSACLGKPAMEILNEAIPGIFDN